MNDHIQELDAARAGRMVLQDPWIANAPQAVQQIQPVRLVQVPAKPCPVKPAGQLQLLQPWQAPAKPCPVMPAQQVLPQPPLQPLQAPAKVPPVMPMLSPLQLQASPPPRDAIPAASSAAPRAAPAPKKTPPLPPPMSLDESDGWSQVSALPPTQTYPCSMPSGSPGAEQDSGGASETANQKRFTIDDVRKAYQKHCFFKAIFQCSSLLPGGSMRVMCILMCVYI